MMTTVADVPHTISDCDLSYVESRAFEVPIAELTRLQQEPREIPSRGLVVRVDGDVPPWLEPTANVLGQLLWLEPNWDSYGALPVDVHHVLAALDLLHCIMRDDVPTPQIVPTNRGGVQIEWHRAGIDIEVETLARTRLLVLYEDANRGDEAEWEQDLRSDWTRLGEVLLRLC